MTLNRGVKNLREHQEKVPYLYILERFRQMDIESLIKGKLVSYDKSRGFINIKMMGEDYQVHYQSGIVYKQCEEVPSYLLRTVLLRYLVNGKGTRPKGQYISYKEIKDV